MLTAFSSVAEILSELDRRVRSLGELTTQPIRDIRRSLSRELRDASWYLRWCPVPTSSRNVR